MRATGALLLMACTVAAGQPLKKGPLKGPPLVPRDAPLVRIPSQAAGAEGIVVRVLKPAKPRFAEGAPVAVMVDGGLSRGGVDRTPARLDEAGFVTLLFLFPGGTSMPQQDGQIWHSGGTFDYRGANCIRALADVIRFAQGEIRTVDGKTLASILGGVKPLGDEVGVIGWSLGGNTAAGAMGLHGKEIARLKWYASYESPYGDGIINAEFGTRGRPNPAYDPATGSLDLSNLSWDAKAQPPGGPARTQSMVLPPGVLFLDRNRSGGYDEGEFAFSPTLLQHLPAASHFSPQLTRAARDKDLLGKAWPAHVATVEQTTREMTLRNGVSQVPAIVRALPNLAVIVWSTEEDHVQGTADYRHIREQYDAYQKAGVKWIRLNPGQRWVNETGKREFAYQENTPNARYDRMTIRKAVAKEPGDGGVPDGLGMTAAAAELADRAHRGEW